MGVERTQTSFILVLSTVGVFNSIAHGTASQLVQLFPPSSTVALQTGFRAPDVLALVLVLAFGFERCGDCDALHPDIFSEYYEIACAFVVVGVVAWAALLSRSRRALHLQF